MGSVLGEEWWVFGVGDEVRLRDGARGWEAWLRSAQGGYAKVRLVAGCGLHVCNIRDKHPSLGFLVGF